MADMPKHVDEVKQRSGLRSINICLVSCVVLIKPECSAHMLLQNDPTKHHHAYVTLMNQSAGPKQTRVITACCLFKNCHHQLLSFHTQNNGRTKINLLNPSGFFTYHQVEHSKFLHGARLALSDLYGYQNRQRLLLYTVLTDWFL